MNRQPQATTLESPSDGNPSDVHEELADLRLAARLFFFGAATADGVDPFDVALALQEVYDAAAHVADLLRSEAIGAAR